MATLSDKTNIPGPPTPIRFLLFSASLRVESLNSRLGRLAARVIEQHGGTVDLASMEEFNCSSYNQDVEEKDGFPPGAAELRKRIEATDAFVISSPEYNGSMPGLLKNVIDWASRYKPQWRAATGACGHCESLSSTWGHAFFQTCSRLLPRTKRSVRRVKSSIRY
jgi:NAD(P)H-dependent FMN reductase